MSEMLAPVRPFLLFAGIDYYPSGGWTDFVGAFDTLDEAKEAVKKHNRGRALTEKFEWAHVLHLDTREIVASWETNKRWRTA